MKFSDEYLDLYDNPATLTQEELSYFHQTADIIRNVLGVDVEITNRDHYREMPGKSKEAYGIFFTADPKNPAEDCFITIDNFFIHECYESKFHGKWNLTFESLENVICHEIAHMTKFRHGKSHKALTADYLSRVAPHLQQQSGTLDEKISQASQRKNHNSRRSTAPEHEKER